MHYLYIYIYIYICIKTALAGNASTGKPFSGKVVESGRLTIITAAA